MSHASDGVRTHSGRRISRTVWARRGSSWGDDESDPVTTARSPAHPAMDPSRRSP